MTITFFSFLMAVIWSSITIILFHIGHRKRRFIKYFGIISLIFFYLICGIRLLLPIEIPGVRVLGLTGAFAEIHEVVQLDIITVFGFHTTFTDLFIGIWLLGILIISCRWTVQYYQAVRKINRIKKSRSSQSEKVLQKVQNVYRRKLQITIWQSPHIDIPLGMGFFRKMILLPEDSYTDEKLYYILLHEYTHFINRDLAVKMLVHFFCCVFWWNPCVYLLKKNLDQTLEIKCDLAVTKNMNAKSKAAYLEVIIALLETLEKRTAKRLGTPATMMFQPEKNETVIERFQVIMDDHLIPGKKKLFIYGWVAFLCAAMVFSYLFQFQAEYQPPESELSSAEELTPDNTYLLDNEDGTYTIIDSFGRVEDTVTDKKALINDMISQGFAVEKERRMDEKKNS